MSNNNKAVQQQQKSVQPSLKEQQGKVSELLEMYKGSIAQALPKHITPDRMIRVALTAMVKQPDLLYCTSHSLIEAVMTAGQLGLMPDSVLGECYLIPFNNNRKGVKEAQIIIGYRGLCALAMRSGQVKSVQARAVFAANAATEDGEEGDFFDYELGLEERLKHIPKGLKDDKYVTHFYAIVKFNNGGHVLNVMTRQEVEKIRDESKNYMYAKDKSSTIWGKYFEEMGCKTVLRRLMKYVPLSPELQKAVSMDEAADLGKQNLGAEILQDPATPEEFKDAVYAEVYEEQQYDQKEAEQEKAGTIDAKVEEAKANLEALMAKKAQKGGDTTAGSK